jgi:hypothetical protein
MVNRFPADILQHPYRLHAYTNCSVESRGKRRYFPATMVQLGSPNTSCAQRMSITGARSESSDPAFEFSAEPTILKSFEIDAKQILERLRVDNGRHHEARIMSLQTHIQKD